MNSPIPYFDTPEFNKPVGTNEHNEHTCTRKKKKKPVKNPHLLLQCTTNTYLRPRRTLIHPPSPGFRVTTGSLYLVHVFRNAKFYRYFDTLRLYLPLVRALAESGCINFMLYPQQFAIFFRLAVANLVTEPYTSNLRCCSRRKLVEIGLKLGSQKEKKNNP